MPCKDCKPNSKRPIGDDGLCATHRRERKNRASRMAWEARIKRTYGIDADTYHELLRLQGGKCFICQRATGKSKRLSVDHDHRSGEVRGLLCSTCNNVLGHVRDDPAAFRRAHDYLTDPPMARLRRLRAMGR